MFLSGFTLKLLAFLFMTIDHVGYAFEMAHTGYLHPVGSVFRIIGRLAFPLFMFFLAEGMAKSHRKGRYMLRILAMYGLITLGEIIVIAIPYFREMGYTERRIDPHPFTDILLNGAMLFFLYQKDWKKALALIPLGIIVFSYAVTLKEGFDGAYQVYFPYFLRSGYGLVGPVFSLGFTLGLQGFLKIKEKNGYQLSPVKEQFTINVAMVFCGAILYIALAVLSSLFISKGQFGASFYDWESWCLLALTFILFYSGRRGYDKTWWRIFSYFYFLLHMGIVFILTLFI